MTDAPPLLDCAQEAIRFLDAYFPGYLGRAVALRSDAHVLAAGGGFGLLALLLARDHRCRVTAWEPRPALRDLCRAWVEENGLADRVHCAGAPEDTPPGDVAAVFLEPPLTCLFDQAPWWRMARRLLGAVPADAPSPALLLPAALCVRAAAGAIPAEKHPLRTERLQPLADHYRAALGADLSPVLEAAAARVHPRMRPLPPAPEELLTPWTEAALDLLQWGREGAFHVELVLPIPEGATVDRVFLGLGLLDAGGTAIPSSLFESKQHVELILPAPRAAEGGTVLSVVLHGGPHGFVGYEVGWSKGDGRGSLVWKTPLYLSEEPSTAPRFHLEDHISMLADVPRLDAYREALVQKMTGGERVVDLGCGTGLLGLAALRQGAAALWAVERDGDVAALARRVLERSGVGERVTIQTGLSRDLAPPEAPAELLVSEILGDKALNEGVLEFMLDARDRFCRPGAAVVPRRLEIYMAGCRSGEYVGDVMEQVRRHLESDMGIQAETYAAARARVLTGDVARYDPQRDILLTDPVRIADFDLETVSAADVHFDRNVELTGIALGTLNAFFVWFVAHLGDGVTLTNDPLAPRSHWRQLRIYDFPPREVRNGLRIRARVRYAGELIVTLR